MGIPPVLLIRLYSSTGRSRNPPEVYVVLYSLAPGILTTLQQHAVVRTTGNALIDRSQAESQQSPLVAVLVP